MACGAPVMGVNRAAFGEIVADAGKLIDAPSVERPRRRAPHGAHRWGSAARPSSTRPRAMRSSSAGRTSPATRLPCFATWAVSDHVPRIWTGRTSSARTSKRSARTSAGALDALRGSTVLVAGGEGFLPSYIVDTLLHANSRGLDPPCRVVSVDNRSSPTPADSPTSPTGRFRVDRSRPHQAARHSTASTTSFTGRVSHRPSGIGNGLSRRSTSTSAAPGDCSSSRAGTTSGVSCI